MKKLLKKARVYWENDNDNTLDIKAKGTMEHLFPELKKITDEEIRKWLINEIKIKHHNLDEDNVDFVDKAIAWLEKLKVFTEHGDGLYYFANDEFTYIGYKPI